MKKFLLLFCLSLFSLVSFASVDTLYFKPGEPGNVELKIDTVKYPYLEWDNVSWFVGFDDYLGHFDQDQNGSNETEATVCALNISTSNVFKDLIITGPNGKKYLHSEEIGESWFPLPPHPRTIVLFNAHQIQATKAVNDYYGTWVDRANLSNSILDTVAVLHIQKELTANDIEFGFKGNQLTYYVGDTVSVCPRLMNNTDSLDINGLYLLNIQDKDTNLLASVDRVDTLQFIPEEDSKALVISIAAVNKFGNYISTFTWPIEVLPLLEIESLQYSTINKEQTVTKTEEDVTEVSFAVLPNDSVRLVVNTNASESETTLTYSWNIDGKGIEADTVITKKNVLTISKFSKELAGTYNCIIKDKDLNKVVATVSFKISYESPTANEVLTDTNYQVTTENGLMTIKNASNQPILITNMLGKQIFVGQAKSDNFTIPTSESGILVIKVGTEVFKVVNK